MASGAPLNVKLPSAVPDKSTCTMCGRPNDPNKVRYCSTCPAWLCKDCVIRHQTIPALEMHQLHDDDTSVSGTYTVCKAHLCLLKYYCRTCSAVVCAECRLDDTHQGHECVDIKTKVEENKQKATEEMEKLKKQKTDLETALSDSRTEYTDADKKWLDTRSTIHTATDKFVEEKRKKNQKASESFEQTVKQAVDIVSEKLKNCSIVANDANTSLNLTELATMSSDVTCRVPDKPTPDTDVTSLITSLTKAVLTPEYVQDSLSKNGLQATIQLKQTVDGTMETVKEFVKLNKIQFKIDNEIHLLAGDRVSIVSLHWVNSYEAWATQNKQSPGELVHQKTHSEGFLYCEDHRFISEQQAELLRLLFGCNQPLPLASKQDLVDHRFRGYYILLVKRIKKVNDVEGDVSVRLFDGRELLPQDRLFYKGTEVTQQCQGQQLYSIWKPLGLNQFDEISVLV